MKTEAPDSEEKGHNARLYSANELLTCYTRPFFADCDLLRQLRWISCHDLVTPYSPNFPVSYFPILKCCSQRNIVAQSYRFIEALQSLFKYHRANAPLGWNTDKNWFMETAIDWITSAIKLEWLKIGSSISIPIVKHKKTIASMVTNSYSQAKPDPKVDLQDWHCIARMLDITLSPSEFNAKYGFSYEMYFIQACKAGDMETVS